MKIVELDTWEDFAERLAKELEILSHSSMVAIRNFRVSSAEVDPKTMAHLGEVDRLAIVKETGTDRSVDSPFWNVPEHDYEHDLQPCGKGAHEIIYAYSASVHETGYTVHLEGEDLGWDLTESLSQDEGILIYDNKKLTQVSKNEYWFNTTPKDALLVVFVLAQNDVEAQ